MKKSELKSIIKECIKEILFEEGILSNLVAEVAFGITKAQGLVVEQKSAPKKTPEQSPKINNKLQEEKRKKLMDTKRKMLDAIGNSKMKNIFEGTEPLKTSGGSGAAPTASPLAGRDPTDAGVDISALFNLAGQKWNALK
jgi:hypothetical protein|tara:strand:+ start:6884 stop:7303 length:420 start_codon:yes stop_codon:yes gene_type:complete